MLKSEDSGGNEDGYLFGVAYCLEGGSYGYFGFAEADVATDEAIHWCCGFHVVFDIDSGFELVGSVLVHEAGFEFVLKVAVGTEGESSSGFAFGVELDEVLGDIFDLLFGLLFQYLPCVAAEAVERWGDTFFAYIAANFVETVYADVESVVVLVYESDDLLLVSVGLDFFKS